MATHKTINRIRFSIDEYPSDEELGQNFLSKSQWQLYKHGVVQVSKDFLLIISDILKNRLYEMIS